MRVSEFQNFNSQYGALATMLILTFNVDLHAEGDILLSYCTQQCTKVNEPIDPVGDNNFLQATKDGWDDMLLSDSRGSR
jgi:hypothetical protein